MAVEIDDWENRIIWDEPMNDTVERPQSQVFLRNELLEDYDWSRNVIYDDEELQIQEIPFIQDPMLLPPILEEPKPSSEQAKRPLDPFNISDDHFYEAIKEKVDDRVRQTFGPIRLEHALPAVKLSFPFVSLFNQFMG
jgi:hypothetical protein